MRGKKRVYWLLVMLLMLEVLILPMRGLAVFAAEKENQPHLIQATTFEGDYKARVELGLAHTPYQEEEDLQKAFSNVLCSCVRIQVKGHYGSGSIYKMKEKEIILVTNRHVLQYWDKDSYVTFFNGRVSEGTVFGVSEEADVGFVSIPVNEFTYEELLAFREIRMEQETAGDENGDGKIVVPETGRVFFMVDMASEWNEPVMKTGEVIDPAAFLEDFQAEMLYGSGDAVPGMSGCGVFDGHGYYLGMISGGTLQNEIAAVPGQTVYMEYEKITKP